MRRRIIRTLQWTGWIALVIAAGVVMAWISRSMDRADLPENCSPTVDGYPLCRDELIDPNNPPEVAGDEFSWSQSFSVNPATIGGAVAVLVVGIGALALVRRSYGRDREYAGGAAGAAFGGPGAVEHIEQVPALITREVIPPDDLPPGLLGALLGNGPHRSDVSATVVDLSVRGYLQLDLAAGKQADLAAVTKLRNPDRDLLEYERLLFDALFQEGTTARLSNFGNGWAFEPVEESLALEMTRRKWYRTRPDRNRRAWMYVGIALTTAAVFATILLAQFTTLGLLGLAAVGVGVTWVVAAPRLTPRTALGRATWLRAQSFRQFLAESDRGRLMRELNGRARSRFPAYLVAFGLEDQWAYVFGDGARDYVPDWCSGSTGDFASFRDLVAAPSDAEEILNSTR